MRGRRFIVRERKMKIHMNVDKDRNRIKARIKVRAGTKSSSRFIARGES